MWLRVLQNPLGLQSTKNASKVHVAFDYGNGNTKVARASAGVSSLHDVLTPHIVPDKVPTTLRCLRWAAHFSSPFPKRAAKPRSGRSLSLGLGLGWG